MQINQVIVIGLLVFCQSIATHQTNLQSKQIDFSISDRHIKFIFNGLSNSFWTNLSLHSFDRISVDCQNSLQDVLRSAQSNHQWAYQMMDSSAGSLTGILNSLFIFPGDYEQCLAVQAINSKHESFRFKGKHFLLRAAPSNQAMDSRMCQNGIDTEKLDRNHWETVQSRVGFLFCFPKYYLLRLGMCLPSTCTAQDARDLLNQTLSMNDWNMTSITEGDVQESWFESIERLKKDHPIAGALFRMYVWSLIIVTLIDLLRLNKLIPMLTKLVNLISIKQAVLHLHRPKEMNETHSQLVNSIRFIAVFLVILFHDGLYTAANGGLPFIKPSFWYLRLTDSVFGQLLFPDVGIPVLFLMGGTTMSAKLIKLLKKKPPAGSFARVVSSRFLKFVPLFAVMIVSEISLPYYYSGPFVKDSLYHTSNNCAKRGWANLFMLSNIFKHDEMCLMHTWSTCAEFQLLLLSVLLAYTYSKSEKAGLVFNCFLIVFGFIFNFVVVYTNDLSGSIFVVPMNLNRLVEVGHWVHLNTLSHLFSYFIVFLVQFLADYSGKLPFTNKKRNVISFFLVFFFLFSFQIPLICRSIGIESNAFNNAVMFSIIRSILPITFAWMLYVEKSLVHKPHLFEKERVLNFLKNAFSMKELSESMKPKLIVNQHQLDSNNNEQDNENKKEKTKKRLPSIVILMNRLLASIYLGHHFYMLGCYFTSNGAFEMSVFQKGSRLIVALVCSFLSGYLFYILVERPVSNLVRLMFGSLLENENKKKFN